MVYPSKLPIIPNITTVLKMGIIGSWEGWIASPTDLYKYGNNSGGWRDAGSKTAVFDQGQITLNISDPYAVKFITTSFSTSGYSYLTIECYVISHAGSIPARVYFKTSSASTNLVEYNFGYSIAGNFTINLNISSINISDVFQINVANWKENSNIKRISLS